MKRQFLNLVVPSDDIRLLPKSEKLRILSMIEKKSVSEFTGLDDIAKIISDSLSQENLSEKDNNSNEKEIWF